MGNEQTPTVLITAIGSANGINVLNGLRKAKKPIKIIGVDSDPLAAGLYLADKNYLVPRIDEQNAYFTSIYKIIKREKVNVVIPTYSKEIILYSKNKSEFEKKTNISLFIQRYEEIEDFIDKFKFYNLLKSKNIPTPQTVKLKDYLNQQQSKIRFPLILKSSKGSGSRSLHHINNSKHLNRILKKIGKKQFKNYIVQQYIQGKEYTVDFLNDFNFRNLGYVARERLKVIDGKCVKSRTIKNTLITQVVEKFFHSIKYIGPGNVQIIIDEDNKAHIIEMNNRFAAGGLPLTIDVGFNIPLILTKLILDPNYIPKTFKKYTKNHYMLRYYKEVFFDMEKNNLEKLLK